MHRNGRRVQVITTDPLAVEKRIAEKVRAQLIVWLGQSEGAGHSLHLDQGLDKK